MRRLIPRPGITLDALGITRSHAKHGTLASAAANVLNGYPERSLFHESVHERHPLALFNLSTGRVIKAVQEVCDQIKVVESDIDASTPKLDSLLKAQEELLEAMLAHIDDSYLILKLTTPNAAVTGPIFADKWLEQQRHPFLATLRQAIDAYRPRVAAIANKVKHNGRRLGWVSLSTTGQPPRHVQGYFLEGGTKGGPDPAIHPQGTAYSFTWDLRHHLANYYVIGDALASALQAAHKHFHGAEVSPTIIEEYRDDRMFNAAAAVQSMVPDVFPDEVSKPYPIIQASGVSGNRSVYTSFPSTNRGRSFSNAKVRSSMTADGVTKTFLIPYKSYFAQQDAARR